MRKTTIILCIIAFANFAALSQIKLPKIMKPKPTPAPQTNATPEPQNQGGPNPSANYPAKRGAARDGVIDDGFTWLEAVNGQTLDEKQAPVSTGWYLKSFIRVFGSYPGRSAFKLLVSKAGKPIATTRCETGSYQNTTGALDESYMVTADCWRKDTATKELGNFDVQVYTVNGQTDEEKLLRTYKIEVRKVERVRGSTTNPEPDAPQYYISRHAEAPVSFMVLRPREYIGYFDWGSGPERVGANEVEFYYNLSPAEPGKLLPHGYMRCSVNGQRLSMPGPMPYADQALSKSVMQYEVIHTDRAAAKYKTGTAFRDDIGFRMVRLKAPLTWGEKENHATNRLALEDYPGNWECSLMNNGEIWRTWRFTIGADGRPPLHPEQRGNINLAFNSYLVDMEIPAGGSPMDKRLVPEAAKSLFYGIPYISAEGKANAAKVPKKGLPYPVASNLVK